MTSKDERLLKRLSADVARKERALIASAPPGIRARVEEGIKESKQFIAFQLQLISLLQELDVESEKIISVTDAAFDGISDAITEELDGVSFGQFMLAMYNALKQTLEKPE